MVANILVNVYVLIAFKKIRIGFFFFSQSTDFRLATIQTELNSPLD